MDTMPNESKIKLINLFERMEHAILLEKNIITCEQRNKSTNDTQKPKKIVKK